MRRREEPEIFADDKVQLAAVNALCDLLESKDERVSAQARALLRRYGPQLERDLSLKPALKPALERLRLCVARLQLAERMVKALPPHENGAATSSGRLLP